MESWKKRKERKTATEIDLRRKKSIFSHRAGETAGSDDDEQTNQSSRVMGVCAGDDRLRVANRGAEVAAAFGVGRTVRCEFVGAFEDERPHHANSASL